MQRIKFTSEELLRSCRFTDPFIHDIWKENEIMEYYKNGDLKEPYLVMHQNKYLIFNGNHRILVAINNHLSIYCQIIESDEDILIAQNDDDRDMDGIGDLSLKNVLKDLIDSSKKWSSQNHQDYDFSDV